jgi:23S rRNA (cytosine1962-C5)-methyltransferase
MIKTNILITETSKDYELLDSGEGQKLERFGEVILRRPDPQALWSKRDVEIWKRSQGNFIQEQKKGEWKNTKELPKNWHIEFGGLKFLIKPTNFKHVGLFPEQVVNWSWLSDILSTTKTPLNIINLFGYTGGATLTCAKAGAQVVHVDGSKSAITWARNNADLSGLADKPIRWILDDARVFVKREIKRGKKYDGIIMDPPSFGHGPKEELWQIEDDLIPLIDDCISILSDKPKFFLLNGYSAGYSAIAYNNIMQKIKNKFGGSIEIGELTIKESGSDGRLLPCGIFARWKA